MKRSKHNLSYTKLLSMDMGRLVPIGLLEVLPGDSIQMSSSALVRAAPLVAPVMHPVSVRIHHWFVPNRIVWDSWEKFITGGPDGNDASTFPTINLSSTLAPGTLGDYFGLPTGIANQTVNALPFRMYAKIYNEWYRDQDLQTELGLETTDGIDTTTNRTIQNIGWEKDYFTSARPWEQKGPSVTIPIAGNAPVTGININTGQSFSTTATGFGTVASDDMAAGTPKAAGTLMWFKGQSAGVASGTNRPQIYADMSQVSGITVNQLRQGLAIQRFEEARARYGSRFPEYLAHLGVRSSDARLQRPEYLGGGKQTIQFSEVLQTAPSGTDPDITPTGALKGHGITAMRSNRFRCFFEEHGYILSLMSVRPKTMYLNGADRHWLKRTKFDYWQKELEHIGQQQIFNKEVYAAHTTPNGVFGYQDRYDEYRRMESRVSGEFRTILDFWHMARSFSSDPALNSTFVSCVPTTRNFAVQTTDPIYCHVRHSIQARRLISSTGSSFTF